MIDRLPRDKLDKVTRVKDRDVGTGAVVARGQSTGAVAKDGYDGFFSSTETTAQISGIELGRLSR